MDTTDQKFYDDIEGLCQMSETMAQALREINRFVCITNRGDISLTLALTLIAHELAVCTTTIKS